MPQLLTGSTFGRGTFETGRRQLIFNMSSGSSVIEVREENLQTDADYVMVPDSSFSASTTFTMYAESSMLYRVVLTGDATCMISGKPLR